MVLTVTPVTARVGSLGHTVRQMQMIASQIPAYMEGSYFYFFYY